ncbi:MAG: DUF1254 domain-containing protein [Desulfobacteraceae bacterium]|nr:DUF1254 domain-containing protein [Desulfobacteraceae bacterium]
MTPSANAQEATADNREEQAFQAGIDAYIYAYPLVIMEATRQKVTNTPSIDANIPGADAPVNQFSHTRELVDASGTNVVAPNNDTLYSTAWLDLSMEPIVLHVPDAANRYYMMPVLDAWTNVIANPGTRTTGSVAKDFIIVGPDFKGGLQAGISVIKSPTNMAWILGRTYTNISPEDVAAVNAFQDGMRLTPLSSYGKPYTPPAGTHDPAIDMKTPPPLRVAKMDAPTFFRQFALALKTNPPAAGDAPMIEKLAQIGIVPGKDFEFENLGSHVQKGLNRCVPAAQAKIKSIAASSKRVNGWRFAKNLGVYGTAYTFRAFITMFGLGANQPEDAVYPSIQIDQEGKPFTGAYRYLLRFEKGQTPPIHPSGFWSITMYNDKRFFVDNPINRYAIHNVDNLTYNADGSLDILLQADPPADEKMMANWLPAPKGSFDIMLRIYWPEKETLDGSWVPPSVKRIE